MDSAGVWDLPVELAASTRGFNYGRQSAQNFKPSDYFSILFAFRNATQIAKNAGNHIKKIEIYNTSRVKPQRMFSE